MFKSMMKNIFKILFPRFYERRYTNQPVHFSHYLTQKIFRINAKCYWPVHWTSKVIGSEYIYVGKGSAPGYSNGCYIVASEKSMIYIGDYTIIAPNVVIPSRNHNIYNYRLHDGGGVSIGSYCWIGANSVILPNVTLGEHTVVGAGSIVTKSFEMGYVVIGGNPAKILKYLDKSKCVELKDEIEYHGFIEQKKFERFRQNKLKC